MFKVVLISTFVLAVSAYDYACPPEGQHFYRYPYDCTKFVECHDGKFKLENCIPGLYFDEGIQYCDFPENVNCVEEIEEPPSQGGPVGTCPQTVDQQGEFAVLLAHSTDCTKYYECDWGVAYEMNCPENLYFNDELKVCDYKAASGCVQA